MYGDLAALVSSQLANAVHEPGQRPITQLVHSQLGRCGSQTKPNRTNPGVIFRDALPGLGKLAHPCGELHRQVEVALAERAGWVEDARVARAIFDVLGAAEV